jgi:transposase
MSQRHPLPGPIPHRCLGDQGPRRGPPRGLERGPTGRPDGPGRELKGARFALWKNPEDLTGRQKVKLTTIEQTNQRLYRAYLLKEQLRQVFHLRQPWRAMRLLDHWLVWARRCRLPAFVQLARSITNHRAGIEAALVHDLSNARVESMNTRLHLLTRIAFGFRSPDALIALAMLSLGGYCPPLPGRS